MKLSIIIPCYNEDQTIKPLLRNILEVNFSIEYEIIVIDDGSKKNQLEFIKDEIQTNKVRFIRLNKNQGKGVAIRIGLKYAKGDIFIIQDADFEYFPSDIPHLLEPILNHQTEVVYGTRLAENPQKMSKSHYLGNIFLTKITNLLYKVNLTDMETGYKLFTRKILNNIKICAREFELEPEITAKIASKGFNIIELPIKYRYRAFGNAKINWLDGLESLIVLIRYRFFKNSRLFSFFYYIFKFHIKKIFEKSSNFLLARFWKDQRI